MKLNQIFTSTISHTLYLEDHIQSWFPYKQSKLRHRWKWFWQFFPTKRERQQNILQVQAFEDTSFRLRSLVRMRWLQDLSRLERGHPWHLCILGNHQVPWKIYYVTIWQNILELQLTLGRAKEPDTRMRRPKYFIVLVWVLYEE